MKGARRDGRRMARRDELREKVGCLLAVREAGERAVLPFDEDAGEDEHVDQEAGLTLGEPKARDGGNSRGADAVAEMARYGFHHRRNSSATRGSNPRPPPRLPLP